MEYFFGHMPEPLIGKVLSFPNCYGIHFDVTSVKEGIKILPWYVMLSFKMWKAHAYIYTVK